MRATGESLHPASAGTRTGLTPWRWPPTRSGEPCRARTGTWERRRWVRTNRIRSGSTTPWATSGSGPGTAGTSAIRAGRSTGARGSPVIVPPAFSEVVGGSTNLKPFDRRIAAGAPSEPDTMLPDSGSPEASRRRGDSWTGSRLNYPGARRYGQGNHAEPMECHVYLAKCKAGITLSFADGRAWQPEDLRPPMRCGWLRRPDPGFGNRPQRPTRRCSKPTSIPILLVSPIRVLLRESRIAGIESGATKVRTSPHGRKA